MKITSVQSGVRESKEKTLAYIQTLFAGDEFHDTDLVALPEMFQCPYENAQFPSYAEPEGGETWQFCSGLARQNGVYLSAGTIPEAADGRIYNTAYVFDRAGRQIAKYRKTHLFDIDIRDGQHFRESDTLTAGDEMVVFDTEFGKMGICICYDLRFPELSRLMTDAGARLILCPAAFNMTTGPMHWELLFRQRAVDNQVFLVGTSPARDEHASYQAWGHSIIVDPWGRVLTEMDETEQVKVTEIDLSVVDEVREQLPLLKHRRSDLYELQLRKKQIFQNND
ncbi:MAG: carbon-nitrogen hydrolase family protein [Clostridiales bacterium]|nr:carbon-nitrogen hydrolase family protein [Clostridiales bacterium]